MELWSVGTLTVSSANIFKKRLAWCAILLFVTTHVKLVSCIATLSLVHTSANCGDHVELTCISTECKTAYTFTKNNITIYNQYGPANPSYVDKYSGSTLSDDETCLTISNFHYSDVGSYSCYCRFDKPAPEQALQYECKANASVPAITSDKKLNITADWLYPTPSKIMTILDNPSSLLLGTYSCVSSPTLASHYRCIWISTASLPDGYHRYTINVTTGTQVAQVSGSFRIVTPTSPAISNLVTISNHSQVLLGVQDTSLTIQCVSKGGIPAPTLAWYRSNTSTSPLAQSTERDSVKQADGTYTLNLTHSIKPGRRDDMTFFLCRVFYPGATNEASIDPIAASALLYLDLEPDTPTLSQTGEAVSGGIMTLQCTASNGRPPPSITWSNQGQAFTFTNTSSLETTSETYTVTSVLQRPVSAVDNGQTATCIVSHTTLSVPKNGSVTVDIKFGPSTSSTIIFGNQAIQATGNKTIRLNCTTGSSNPVSNITWYNESDVISHATGYKTWIGDNNGVITSDILTITPTRYMDGNRIICRVDNSYGSDSIYVDLNISYSARIQPLINITLTEGEPDVSLTCVASSKPAANFIWFRGNMVLAIGTGTITHNSFSHTIPRVDRSDAGCYQCKAGNGVGSSDLKNMYLFVKYPPTVTVSTTTFPSYTVTCTAEGYPDSYTYQDWVQIWPGYGPVATIKFNEETLNMTGATYERSGVYVCSASNGVARYGTDVKLMKGNATVLIQAPPVLTDPSSDGTIVPVAGKLGQDATTKIKYWSNVDGSVVKCYKFVEGSRSSSMNCSVTYTDTEVTLPVHNHMITETGTLATIKIHISSQEDMAAYDVVVSNSVQGESILSIIIVPQVRPEAPTLLGNFSMSLDQVKLTVLPGFHGGSNQTLVVQISTDLTTWINKTSVYIGQDSRTTDIILTSLRKNTLHHVRVFAYNAEGGSNTFSTVMNFTTAKDQSVTSTSTALIGGSVGSLCALLAVSAVLVVVWRNRKAGWILSKKADERSLAKDEDNADSVVECAMYVSAGKVQPGTSKDYVYPTSQKMGRPDPSINMISKSKEGGKKGRTPRKPTQGLPEIPPVAETTFETTNHQTFNPPSRSMKNVTDDGLIYADLEFDSNAKYGVIHGLDDITIYVEIDFTKAAEPLQDSDKESTEKK